MKPLLSIAIPSNNRTELLDQALRSILAEPGFDERCEVCVSDNSRGTLTESMIGEKYASTPRFIYRRSLDAPSLDENVNQVITLAQGEYAWVFGDDDLIVPGFLAELVDYLERAAPDILLVNSRSFQHSGVVEVARVPQTELGIYGPAEDNAFLADFASYLTYVPCLVIRRSLWLEHFRPSKVGTFFAHIDAVYRAKHGHSAHFLPQPGIAMRMHFQTWATWHFEIWNIHFPAVIWGLEGYSDEAKSAVIPRFPLRSLKRILGSRAYGRFDLKIWRAVLLPSPNTTGTVKFLGYIIAMLPREMFRLLYIAFIRLRRNRHSRGFSPELALAQLGRAGK